MKETGIPHINAPLHSHVIRPANATHSSHVYKTAAITVSTLHKSVTVAAVLPDRKHSGEVTPQLSSGRVAPDWWGRWVPGLTVFAGDSGLNRIRATFDSHPARRGSSQILFARARCLADPEKFIWRLQRGIKFMEKMRFCLHHRY
jgi:hypothetical protein